METFKIKKQQIVQESTKTILKSASNNDAIIADENHFETVKKRLQLAYDKLINGETKLYDIDELDEMLEKSLSEHEN